MKQDKEFIGARDKVRKYISSRHYKKKSTIIKMNGWLYNNEYNGQFNSLEIDDVRSAIDSARKEIIDNHDNGLKVIQEFEKELNRIRNGVD